MRKIYLLILTLCSAMLFTTACLGDGDMVNNKPSQGQQTPQPEPEPEPEQPGDNDEPAIDPETYDFPFICTDPKFVTADMTQDVLVYINTAGTSMDGFTGDIYAHTGVLTSTSATTADWKYVKAEWTDNIADCKLSKVKQNVFKLVIKGGPRDRKSVV